MKRMISLWLGLVAFALLPALAQTSAPTGKIHGRVTGPEGATKTVGTVSLSTDGGKTSKFSFPVSATGDYTGEAAPGTYTLVYRAPDTPPDKLVDSIDGVKIVAGQDLLQDDDMTRKEFIDRLSPEQKKELDDLKKHNAEALKSNAIINGINADIKTSSQDFKDADNARAEAVQALPPTASRADIATKESEIKAAKYSEIETLMLKDTVLKPDASTLWGQLGQAQSGLKKYDDAEISYKKAIELEAASKKPNITAQGAANAGLGEIYARTGKIPEANAAYDAAAKVNPTMAGLYLKNETVIFFQIGNGDAQTAAADEAIAANPTDAILYYLKGNGLIQKATIDAKTGMYILPPGCAEAYKKYLDLAPTGQFANDAKAILTQAGQKIETSYKAGRKN